MSNWSVAVIDAKRTPIGSFQGGLSKISAPALAGFIISYFAKLGYEIESIFLGCVLTAGLGQSPARQAGFLGGLGPHVPAVVVNKVCGSSMQAVTLACDQIRLGQGRCIIAGGMENMSLAPYMLPQARPGYRLGHGHVLDHMMYDGLEDHCIQLNDKTTEQISGIKMGLLADATCQKYGFNRSDLHDFVENGLTNYTSAFNLGLIQSEIITGIIDYDEPPIRVMPQKFSKLSAVFSKEGVITVASSSSIADGAAALLLGHVDSVSSNTVLGYIVGYTTYSTHPADFIEAPIGATRKLCTELDWDLSDIDAFEVNEAFAVVPLLFIKELKIASSRVNQWGGSCVLGHPISASGARIIGTLLRIMNHNHFKKGIATICIGGGEAIAIAVECCK